MNEVVGKDGLVDVMGTFGGAIERVIRRRYLPLPENQSGDEAVLEPKVRGICALAFQAALGEGGEIATRLCKRSKRDAFILFAPSRYAEGSPEISWVGCSLGAGTLVILDSAVSLEHLLSFDVVRCRLSLDGFIAIKGSRRRMQQRLGGTSAGLRAAG